MNKMTAGVAKDDSHKPRLDLVPPALIEAVGIIRDYGTRKYHDPENWRQVAPERYRAAMMRHLCLYLRDPGGVDEESGYPHLWHLACNVAFLIALETPEPMGWIPMPDNVNHPSHYAAGKVECIDALESATEGLVGIEAICTANAIKCLWRWRYKRGVEDLRKAEWYVDRLIKRLEGSA